VPNTTSFCSLGKGEKAKSEIIFYKRGRTYNHIKTQKKNPLSNPLKAQMKLKKKKHKENNYKSSAFFFLPN